MTADHLDEMAELEQVCFSAPWSRAMLAEELKNLAAAYVVAEAENGAVLGYAGLHAVADEGYITNVAVRPECRRQGVATALLKVFFRFAAARRLRFLTLEARASNKAARALYAGLGFREAGVRRNYYETPREDAVLLTKDFRWEDDA
jgi:ribosomal-protein-alanine N-acetyltransferase